MASVGVFVSVRRVVGVEQKCHSLSAKEGKRKLVRSFVRCRCVTEVVALFVVWRVSQRDMTLEEHGCCDN